MNVNRSDVEKMLNYLNGNSLFQGEGLLDAYDMNVDGITTFLNGGSYANRQINYEGSQMSLIDATAASYDSEMDLYIAEVLQNVFGTNALMSETFANPAMVKKLKDEYNIVIEPVSNTDGRAFNVSLVDEDGKVRVDGNNKKASIVFSDSLIPDGYAQGTEYNMSSILDQMGYECVSKADFIGKEEDYQKMLDQYMTGSFSDAMQFLSHSGNGTNSGNPLWDDMEASKVEIESMIDELREYQLEMLEQSELQREERENKREAIEEYHRVSMSILSQDADAREKDDEGNPISLSDLLDKARLEVEEKYDVSL